MHYSKLIVCAALVVAASALVVEASRQYANGGNSNNSHDKPRVALTHYGGGAQSVAGSQYGGPKRPEYHAYAVKPAVYGGHRMYNYRGYARHYPAPARKHKRRQRSGSQAHKPRHYHQPANNRYAPSKNNNYQQASEPEMLPAGYTLKPIRALALVPVSHGSQYFNLMVRGNNHGA